MRSRAHNCTPATIIKQTILTQLTYQYITKLISSNQITRINKYKNCVMDHVYGEEIKD